MYWNREKVKNIYYLHVTTPCSDLESCVDSLYCFIEEINEAVKNENIVKIKNLLNEWDGIKNCPICGYEPTCSDSIDYSDGLKKYYFHCKNCCIEPSLRSRNFYTVKEPAIREWNNHVDKLVSYLKQRG